jgi:DNA repair protein RecO (recombination protein O)
LSLIKTQGVVLKYINLNESDKIITILTDKVGKIDVVVHGAKSHKSKFLSSTQPFCYGEYMLFKGKSMYSLSQSSIIESFQKIIMDLDKLMYGSYFLELVDGLTEYDTKNVSVLALLLKTLYIMTHNDTELDLFKTIFEFKIISLSGYMPQINYCIKCKNETYEGYFNIENGGIVCSSCGKTNQYDYKLNKTMVNYLQKIKNIKLEDINKVNFNSPEMDLIKTIVQKYIIHHSNRNFKSLDIIKKMK